MNEKQKKVVGLGAVALAAIAFFAPQQTEDFPQGFTGGFPISGSVGGGGTAREEPSLAEQLQNVFQPPQSPYLPVSDRAPALAKKNETLTETAKRIGSSPVPPEAIEFGGQEQVEKLLTYQEGVAPSPSWFESLRGYNLDFSPAPSGTVYQSQPMFFTPISAKSPAYPGPGKDVSIGGWDIPGIGSRSKYVSGGSSTSSSKKSSGTTRGPISFNTPKKAPENLEGVITGVISTPKSGGRKTKGGLTIRKTTAAEKAKYEAQRKKRLKVR